MNLELYLSSLRLSKIYIRNILILLTLVLLGINLKAQKVIFREDFSDNLRAWEEGSNESEFSKVDNGRYTIKSFDNNSHWYRMNTGLSNEGNWVIETTIYVDDLPDTSGYIGFFFGGKDADNMFQILIYPNKKEIYGLALDMKEFFDLFPKSQIESLVINKLHFTVVKYQSEIRVLLNEIPIGKFDCDSIFGGDIGFLLNKRKSISVDDITINVFDDNNKDIKSVITSFETSLLDSTGWEYFTAKGDNYQIVSDYPNAISNYQRSLSILEKDSSKENISYAGVILRVAKAYMYLGEYANSEKYYKDAVEITKLLSGEFHFDYAIALNGLGLLYVNMGLYEKAEPPYIQSMKILGNISEEQQASWIIFNINLAQLYQYMGKYDNADSLYNRILPIGEKEFGKSSTEYARILFDFGRLKCFKGDFNPSIKLVSQSVDILKNTLGETHLDFAGALISLAYIYTITGDFPQAEKLNLQAKSIYQNTVGESHPLYATVLNNLSTLYLNTGDDLKAEAMLQQSAALVKKSWGDNNSNYAKELNMLGEFYSNTGNYAKAEDIFQQSKEIFKNSLGETHPDYGGVLTSLGLLYYKLHNYSKAEKMLMEALSISGKIFGTSNPNYAISLFNLGVLYSDMGDHDKAKMAIQRAVEIFKSSNEQRHPYYGKALNALAINYAHFEDYKNAELLYKECLQFEKDKTNEHTTAYALVLNNLATLYSEIHESSKAEAVYKQAIEIYKTYPLDPDRLLPTKNLAYLYVKNNEYYKAEPLYQESFHILQEDIKQQLTFLSESEQEKYLDYLESDFQTAYSFYMDYSSQKRETTKGSYDLALFTKGMRLNTSKSMRQSILSMEDTITISLYMEWIAIKKNIARQLSNPNDEQKNIEALESRANELEKQLIRISADFKQKQEAQLIDWQKVKNSLKKNEAAIEFVSFWYTGKGDWPDSIFYCAYILRPDYNFPQQVFLFEEKQLDSLLIFSRGEKMENTLQSFYSYKTQEKSLYNLIWGKIEPYLKGASTVYYSPGGNLNRISFPAIPTSDTTVLLDKYHLVQLNSTREITLESFKPLYVTDTSSIDLFGGIKYDMDTAALKNATANYHKDEQDQSFVFASRSYLSDTSSRGTSLRYLPGTLNEVEFIKPLFKQSNLFTGALATEEALKSLQGKQAPDILHVATHGFFFRGGQPKPNRTGKIREFEFSSDPLIRSGLIMAGGNLKWKGAEIPDNLEDGILTAKEVAALNLYNTKLVVLSACETGLGEIKGSEGVYGLQRAFKAAGSDYLLMSLWSVPDKPTAEFMQTFYTKLKTGSDIQTSFEQTQTVMKLQYKNEPYNWAGFVLVR